MFDYNTESRLEHILSAIAGLEELPDYPEQSLTRVERILYAIAQGGGAGVEKGYFYNGQFYKDPEHTELIEPEEGKIYYDLTGKVLYIYDGENYKGIADSSDSDVVDIVNTYADLQSYDTSKLKDRDIIKVLADETHDGKIAYYRWLKATATWEFVGAQGPYYTTAEIDELLAENPTKAEIVLTGESGTLTAEQIDLVTDDTKNVVLVNAGELFYLANHLSTLTYRTYINFDVAQTEDVVAKAIYIQLNTTAANYGAWTLEDVAIGADVVLYSGTGQNTDGAMTQKATTDALATKSTVTWRTW